MESHSGARRRRPDACFRRNEQSIFRIDERSATIIRHLEARGKDDRIRGARLFTEAAKDAPQLVDFVPCGIAFPR